MQHFYFHLHNSLGIVPDEEGKLLPDIDQAREQARLEIRSILSEEAKEGVIDLTGRVEIAGDGGDILAVVPFAQAVELRTEQDSP
jgi:hypothetical protein